MPRTLPPTATVLTAVLAVLGFAVPSQAGRIDIDFDFSGSSVSIFGGAVSIPPDGQINSASGTIGVSGAGLVTASAGPGAKFRDLTLDASLDATTFGLHLTGGAQATQLADANGSLSLGLGNLVFGNAQLNLDLNVNCSGSPAACGLLGLPLSSSGPQTLALGTIPISGLGIPGAGFVSGAFSITLGGLTAVLNLVGTEVSRTYVVPEPHTIGLLALGLVGMAGMRWAYRRR